MHSMSVIPAFARALIDWFIYIIAVIGSYFSSDDEADTDAE